MPTSETPLSKKNLFKRWTIGAVLGVLFLSGLFLFKMLKPAQERIAPRMGPVIEAVYGLGTVVAPQTYQVKTAINQSISDVYVREGDAVKAGDRLIKFDESGIKLAPFSGTITSVFLKKGELLFPSTVAMTLVNLDDLLLEVSLEQQAVLSVKKDQPALVSFESVRSERLVAKVQSIFPRDSQFIVRILLERIPGGILPGMTADVAIEVGRKQNVLSIPLRAISAGRVTLVRSGKAIKDAIQVGVVDGEWAEVTSGNIQASDEILVRSK